MTVPAVVLLAVFAYIPMFGLITAFTEYDIYSGFWQSVWVGTHQVDRLFTDGNFWQALSNTLYISAVQLVLYFPIPIVLALVCNQVLNARLRSFVQSVVYLPHFFSWVLVVTIFQQMLGGAGALNTLLRRNGLGTWDVMTDPGSFAFLVTAQAVWK